MLRLERPDGHTIFVESGVAVGRAALDPQEMRLSRVQAVLSVLPRGDGPQPAAEPAEPAARFRICAVGKNPCSLLDEDGNEVLLFHGGHVDLAWGRRIRFRARDASTEYAVHWQVRRGAGAVLQRPPSRQMHPPHSTP
jgi:hypothetical protein